MTSAAGLQGFPTIHGNRIVWMDQPSPGADTDLRLYNFVTKEGQAICEAPGTQATPQIFGTQTVWDDSRNGNTDIYLFDQARNQEFQITRNGAAQSGACIYNGKVCWVDLREGWPAIYMAEIPPAHRPVLDPIGDKSIDEYKVLDFTVSGSDPDGDALAYSADNLPNGATFDPATRKFRWKPGYSQAGTYSGIRFTVSDGSLSDSEEITITVNNVNRKPAVGTVSPSSGSGPAGSYVTFTTTCSDPDGWRDVRYSYFLVNQSTGGSNCSFAYYNQNTHKLYLRNDAGDAWLGDISPGSSRLIENSYAVIDCSGTTVSGSGDTLTIRWRLKFKPAFKGAKNSYIRVRDDPGVDSGWYKKGTWTVK